MSLESMRARVEELATPRFTDGAEDALLVGGPGVGKTRLAVAIGVEAAKAGREVRFAGCARLWSRAWRTPRRAGCPRTG
jgi:DNA replication protein DnaC